MLHQTLAFIKPGWRWSHTHSKVRQNSSKIEGSQGNKVTRDKKNSFRYIPLNFYSFVTRQRIIFIFTPEI